MSGFIIWHQGRCGSSVLSSLLDQNSSIACSKEIFSRFMPKRRTVSTIPSMQSVYDSCREAHSSLVAGLEIKYLTSQNFSLYPDSSSLEWFESGLRSDFSKHIIVQRKNGLRRLISHLIRAQTGVVQSLADSPCSARKVLINCAEVNEGAESRTLLEWLKQYSIQYERLKEDLFSWCLLNELPQPLMLSYEDHIKSDPVVAYKKVCGFLGVPCERVDVVFRRINPEPMPLLVENWKQVYEIVAGSEFSWMVNDVN